MKSNVQVREKSWSGLRKNADVVQGMSWAKVFVPSGKHHHSEEVEAGPYEEDLAHQSKAQHLGQGESG
jgi:hypothetical protein